MAHLTIKSLILSYHQIIHQLSLSSSNSNSNRVTENQAIETNNLNSSNMVNNNGNSLLNTHRPNSNGSNLSSRSSKGLLNSLSMEPNHSTADSHSTEVSPNISRPLQSLNTSQPSPKCQVPSTPSSQQLWRSSAIRALLRDRDKSTCLSQFPSTNRNCSTTSH